MADEAALAEIRGYANKVLLRAADMDTKALAFCVIQLCDVISAKEPDEDTPLFGWEADAHHDQGAAVDRVKQAAQKRLLVKLFGLE